MSMQSSDRIVAPSRADAASAKGYASAGGAHRPGDCQAYIDAVYGLCQPDDLPDASIVVAQSVHETSDPGPWQSHWWTERLNPAGMGVTGDPVQNASSPWFADGTEAARAQVSHLLLYATGSIDRGGLSPADDPRYAAYVEAYGHTAQATTIQALSGKWGTDPQYGQKVADRGNQVWPNLPGQGQGGGGEVDEIVFGRVPHPSVDIRDIANNTAWDDLGPRTIRSIVWHRMVGTLWGTDSWFRGGGSASALTDYGVGVAATDGANEAGHLMRWNDPRGRRSPWASGPYRAGHAYGDGEAFVQRYGVDAVNRDTTALEISGDYGTPLDEKSREVIAALTAYWADRYRVPYTTFPMIEAEDRSVVIYHNEFCGPDYKPCPGEVVTDETSALMDRARSILQEYQVQGAAPEPPASAYPASRIPIVPKSQGYTLELTAGAHRYVATHGGHFLTAPSRDAPYGTPTPYGAGQTGTFPYTCVVDEEVWLASKAGSWTLLKNWTAEEGS